MIVIEVIGYWFCVVVAFLALAGLTALVALLNVLASKYFLDMLGGWKVFLEFRAWLVKNKRDKR
ncbi:hypothetical protein [uncultured Mediterranean phage uvMED]|nr:hypothetical protein [uncultured Mediterranean phage uvMED]